MELAKQLRKRMADGDAVFGTFVAELKAAGAVTVDYGLFINAIMCTVRLG